MERTVGCSATTREKIARICERHRLIASKGLVTLMLIIVLVTSHSWRRDSFVHLAFETIGFFLIVICVFGRVWASMYIAGKKDEVLTTGGPYSMVRNPLYFFSFLGAVGFGLSSENLLALGLIIVMFVVGYVPVILSEERRLLDLFGEEYQDYMNRKPRLFPKLSKLGEPVSIGIHTGPFLRVLFRSMWFMWFFMLLHIVEKLRDIGWIPVVLAIP
ncbi:MAG: isoprenylcysteine carboxylmethyltransferase family protein [Deltaproteobacteria bacterium HGW-Deltaproteobacteria-15]|jgi:protein-S-isoprenylcysteine O-methyltransferase Ste14|nr:MAG: isoprenylcysteine carboxylmethyltransferase family protein [Deltaproteobacteria bacterium HGW-Deltaproteobacteria-15]